MIQIKNKKELYASFVLLVICAILAYFEPLRMIVLKVDREISLLINTTLSEKNWWTIYWGNMNSPIETYVSLLSMLIMACMYILISKDKKSALSMVISMLFYLELCVFIKLLVVKAFAISRLSPSNVIDNYYLLSKLLGNHRIKDGSGMSFPGDHAMVMFFIVFYSRVFYPSSIKIVTFVLAIIFVTPRVVAGAHWTSDVLCSVVIVFFYANILVLTPIHDKTVAFIRVAINKCSRSSVG